MLDFGLGGSPWDFGDLSGGIMPPDAAGFSDRFNAATGADPTFGQPRAVGTIPEQMAGTLASQGITPQQFVSDPAKFAPMVKTTLGGPQPTSLGANLEPVPNAGSTTPGAPLPSTPGAGTPTPDTSSPTVNPEAAKASASAAKNPLLQTLAGLRAPAAPVPQKVSTPNALNMSPHGTIKAGNLIALLAALQGQNPTAKVPLGLGQSIGGR